MKIRFLVILIVLLVARPSVAILLDEEEPAVEHKKTAPQKPISPKPIAPPHARKSSEELENERLKRELENEKMRAELDAIKQQKSAQDAKTKEVQRVTMIQLPIGIKMGKYEVTQGLWKAVMGSNPSRFSSCGDDCPVESVSWNDVQNFIERLNQQTGQRFRLPSEEEWFTACQAGYSSDYCGSSSIEAVAWYNNPNYDDSTHQVGRKQANAWGLYDMSGNVWEWTNSCYEGDCARRVLRGGSWYNTPESVRAAYRNRLDVAVGTSYDGFRLVQDR